jgi:Cupin domain
VIIPATQTEPDPRAHEGYEWLYVLSGRLRLVLGDHDLMLNPGEAAEFATRLPHWFGSTGGQPVEILSILGRQGERMHVRAKATSTTANPGTNTRRQCVVERPQLPRCAPRSGTVKASAIPREGHVRQQVGRASSMSRDRTEPAAGDVFKGSVRLQGGPERAARAAARARGVRERARRRCGGRRER